MARPCKCRRVQGPPVACYFKPKGIPLPQLQEVVLTVDELEALRLADLEGLYQENAAQKMGVSRPTFGNIIAAARRKVADSLVHGKALKIEGGTVEMAGRRFVCCRCHSEWMRARGPGRPGRCPKCQSTDIQRAPACPGRNARCGSGGKPSVCRRTDE
jgi:predicted DNA-binding protein (UPF0251 family)